jgi:hypothetical protein
MSSHSDFDFSITIDPEVYLIVALGVLGLFCLSDPIRPYTIALFASVFRSCCSTFEWVYSKISAEAYVLFVTLPEVERLIEEQLDLDELFYRYDLWDSPNGFISKGDLAFIQLSPPSNFRTSSKQVLVALEVIKEQCKIMRDVIQEVEEEM